MSAVITGLLAVGELFINYGVDGLVNGALILAVNIAFIFVIFP